MLRDIRLIHTIYTRQVLYEKKDNQPKIIKNDKHGNLLFLGFSVIITKP